MKQVENGSSENTSELEYKRQLFIQYCANMRHDPETGEKVTMEVFARTIQVDPKTLYQWQKRPGFRVEVAKETDQQLLNDLPQASKIVRKYALKGSYNHLKLWYMQADSLKAERTETTGEITHKFEDMDDEALDRIIKARQDRLA